MHAATLDSEYLLNLSRHKSVQSRQALGRVMADLFDGELEELTERERFLMFDIIHTVVLEFEMPVRRALSRKMAEVKDAPAELIRIFANDEIDVAYPILTESKVLRNFDLIEIIRQRSLEHSLAIAMRPGLDEDVTDALVETEHSAVIKKLLENGNARISRKTMEYLVEQSKRVSAYQEPLLRRKDVPQKLAKRMFMWVSAALRQFIIENFDINRQVIDEMLEEIARIEIRSSKTANKMPKRTRDLAEDMKGEGLIDSDMLVNTLQSGEIALFVSMFSQLTGLREFFVKRILFEPGGEGMAIACKAIELNEGAFRTIFSLSRKAKPGHDSLDADELLEAAAFFAQAPAPAAKEVLATWQRGSDYLAGIRDLKLGLEGEGGKEEPYFVC